MRRLLLVPLLLLGLPALAPAAIGPSVGVVFGNQGVVDPHGLVRYVAVPSGKTTTVETITTDGGQVVLSRGLPGSFGVPVVTSDGKTGGVAHDGRTLVLATYPTPQSTRFAVLDTNGLKLKRVATLRGSYTYDALSPDGRTLYLIENSLGTNTVRYRVRAYDVAAGRLLPGTIADKRFWGKYMRGTPITRATTADGGWVYTLYGKPDGTAFVHALDARNRAAVCVNLPWRHTAASIGSVKLSLSGGQLVLSQPRAGKLAMIDTRSFAIRAFRPPGA
jgi:hypothetical protein